MCLALKCTLHLWLKERLFRQTAKCRKALYVEMMGLIGAGNNPMVGMTVAVAVAVEEAGK